jgi:transposase-like protein
MPPSRTVAPYSPTRTPLLGVEAVLGHEKHPPPFIRDTNAIEALNRQLRKAIKTKGHFPNEEAARNLIYLAIVNAVPAWTRTRNWTTALLAFKIHFGHRLPK